jgi:integrase
VLTDQELATIIVAARQMPTSYGGIVELLALTGQRRQEVSKLKWEELDEKSRTWSIPGSRTKNKKAHIVHLSEPAWQVIAQSLTSFARMRSYRWVGNFPVGATAQQMPQAP